MFPLRNTTCSNFRNANFLFVTFRYVEFVCVQIRNCAHSYVICSDFLFAKIQFATFQISKVLYFQIKKCQSFYFWFSTSGYQKLKNLDFLKVIWCFKIYFDCSYSFRVTSFSAKSILILNLLCVMFNRSASKFGEDFGL